MFVKDSDREYGDDLVFFNQQRQYWVAQFNASINGGLVRKSASGQTEEEALRKLQAKKRALFKSGAIQKKAKLTFAAAMDKLMSSIKGTVQDKSYSEYEYRAELLKMCPMAAKKLDQLDIPAIQVSINFITAEKNLCESTCGKLIAFIKRTYQFAVDSGDVARSPVSAKKCLKIPVVATESENVLPLSKQDLTALYAVLNGTPRIKPIVYCMLCAGLRIGEVLALTWDKIRFDEGTHGELIINRAVKKYKVKGGTGTRSEYRIGPPKTKSSVRRVGMSPKLREVLLEWKGLQQFHAADKTGLNLVFPKRNGVLQDYDSFNIGFNKYLAKVGLDYHKYHSRVFRHTFASYLVKQGVKVKTLQKLMGHAKIETTFQYYVDTDQDSLNEAIQLIDVTLNSSDFTFRNFGENVLLAGDVVASEDKTA